jgi:AraC-like DNA-binding protein
MTNSQRFATVRFFTADLPEQDRVAVWREHYGRMALRIDLEPAKDAKFECALVSRALPELQLLSAKMSPVRVARTREFVADGNDDLVLIINQTGAINASGCGRDVALKEGDAVLMSSSEVSVFNRHSAGGSLSLRMPRSVLSSIVVNVEDAVMQHIPQNAGALKLLANYTGAFLEEHALASPEIRSAAINHVHDLIALTLGAMPDAAAVAKLRGVPAARLKLAKAYIIANSNRRNLSVGAVAAHLGVTPRNVQQLFESEGTTFSAFLLAQRLTRAHRMLTELRFAHSAIGAIAYDVGFGDLSYFNRCFKRRYGTTPREIRNGSTM